MCVQDLKARGTPFPGCSRQPHSAIVALGTQCWRLCGSELREISVSSAKKGVLEVETSTGGTHSQVPLDLRTKSDRMRPSGPKLAEIAAQRSTGLKQGQPPEAASSAS